MNILFYLGHPSHFYYANALAKNLANHKILFVARSKDILLDLLENTEFETKIIIKNDRKNSRFSMIINVLRREWHIFWISLKFNPDIYIGTDLVITHIGKIFNKPSFLLNEDDEKVVPLLAKFGFKYSTKVISPKVCKLIKYHYKKVEYNGFHKLIYLHPKYFTPSQEILNKYNIKQPYYLIRLSALNAHHDKNIKGISPNLLDKIIRKLNTKGVVYLSSEELNINTHKNLILNIEPIDFHHILYFAEMLISDSQSMSVEAAMIGTPSIRYSSFSGRISVLEELEHRYGLTYGIRIDEEEKLLSKIDELLHIVKLKSIFQKKRETLLKENIDVNKFICWFISNYPQSENSWQVYLGQKNK